MQERDSFIKSWTRNGSLPLLGIVGVLLIASCGCEAGGYAPGPMQADQSVIPVGQGRNFVFSGERDTAFDAVLEGNDGINIPNGTISLTRLASAPINARGQQQALIEDQRDRHWDRILDRVDRRLDRLEDNFLMPAFTQRQAQQAQLFERDLARPQQEDPWKRIEGLINQAVQSRIGVPSPAPAPAPTPAPAGGGTTPPKMSFNLPPATRGPA